MSAEPARAELSDPRVLLRAYDERGAEIDRLKADMANLLDSLNAEVNGAAEALAAEREACARLADRIRAEAAGKRRARTQNLSRIDPEYDRRADDEEHGEEMASGIIAMLIRKRGETRDDGTAKGCG